MKKFINKILRKKRLAQQYAVACNRSQTIGDNFIKYKSYSFSNEQVSKIKNIALYLPQFHSIPENDEWWGKNFTEWNNVVKAVPQYLGQHQPQLPIDLGFYDLLNEQTLVQQVDIARNYGIYGFCYYFYWFNGRRILDKPLEILLNNEDISMPFCLFWANDSWVRTWHGFSDFEQGDRTLLQQIHNDEDDVAVMEYLCKNIFNDIRYIKVNNKPVFVLYHIYLFKNINHTIEVWRRICKQNGFDDILILNVMMPDLTAVDPTTYGFDATLQFSPIATLKEDASVEILNPQFSGDVYSYEAVVKDEIIRKFPHHNVVRGAFMAWDNEARRPTKGISYAGSSPQLFLEYLTSMSKYALDNKINGESFVFINAWNEWAEGAHLEPDREYGYAWLEVVANVINFYNGVNNNE